MIEDEQLGRASAVAVPPIAHLAVDTLSLNRQVVGLTKEQHGVRLGSGIRVLLVGDGIERRGYRRLPCVKSTSGDELDALALTE